MSWVGKPSPRTPPRAALSVSTPLLESPNDVTQLSPRVLRGVHAWAAAPSSEAAASPRPTMPNDVTKLSPRVLRGMHAWAAAPDAQDTASPRPTTKPVAATPPKLKRPSPSASSSDWIGQRRSGVAKPLDSPPAARRTNSTPRPWPTTTTTEPFDLASEWRDVADYFSAWIKYRAQAAAHAQALASAEVYSIRARWAFGLYQLSNQSLRAAKRSYISRILSRMLHLLTARGWSTWVEMTRVRLRQRSILSAVTRHWLTYTLSCGMNAWTRAWEHRSRIQRMQTIGRAHGAWRGRLAAWQLWRKAAHAQARALRIMRIAAASLCSRQELRVWRKWLEVAERRGAAKMIVARALRHMLRRDLSVAWLVWGESVDRLLTVAALRSRGAIAMWRWGRRKLGGSLADWAADWHEATATNAAREARRRACMHVARLRRGRQLVRAMNSWLALRAERVAARRTVRRCVACMRLYRELRAMRAWIECCTAHATVEAAAARLLACKRARAEAFAFDLWFDTWHEVAALRAAAEGQYVWHALSRVWHLWHLLLAPPRRRRVKARNVAEAARADSTRSAVAMLGRRVARRHALARGWAAWQEVALEATQAAWPVHPCLAACLGGIGGARRAKERGRMDCSG